MGKRSTPTGKWDICVRNASIRWKENSIKILRKAIIEKFCEMIENVEPCAGGGGDYGGMYALVAPA